MTAKTKNQSGISIKLEVFLPTGTSVEEAYTALSMVRDATESGDYQHVLKAATVDSITVRQLNRRVPVVDEPVADPAEPQEMPLSQRKGKDAA